MICLKFSKSMLIKALVFGFSLMPNVVFAEKNNTDDFVLNVTNVDIQASEKVSADEIIRLVPELEKQQVNVSRLSKNIQIINDMGAMNLKTQFIPQDDGSYHALVLVEDGKKDVYSVGVNNSGDDFTGNWRTSISYGNRDLSQNGDALSVAYVTSPNHLDDVHQAMVNYKVFLPKTGDSLSVGYSYSDSDMGQIADIYGLGLFAKGDSRNLGIHYQHNLKYTRAKKQIIDIGFDYKKYNGIHELRFGGMKWAAGGYEFSENVLSLNYTDISIGKNNVLSYTLGYSQNLKGDKEAYSNYRTGADDMFHIVKGNVTYQHYLPSQWVLVGSLEGQFTNDDLVGTEQLGIGGMGSIRGFKSGAASGDKGYKFSLEAYTPEIALNSKLVLFTDIGYVFNNNYNIGEMKKELASYGLGYRFNDKNGLSITLDYAKVVKDDGVSDYYRLPWHFSLVKTF